MGKSNEKKKVKAVADDENTNKLYYDIEAEKKKKLEKNQPRIPDEADRNYS